MIKNPERKVKKRKNTTKRKRRSLSSLLKK